MSLTDEIKKLLRDEDVDLVGVANVERFEHAPEGRRPEDLLHGAKSVIVIGLGIGKGITHTNRNAYSGNRRAIYPYLMYGYVFLNNTLNTMAYKVTRYLEHRGYTALPLPASPPNDSHDNVGAFSNRHAAVAAGFGEFGWNTLLITPEFGPRIRVVSVITDAELEPDPLYSGERICDVEKCKLLCSTACPLGALPAEDSVSLKIGDREFTYANLDKWKCKLGVMGYKKAALGRKDIEIPEGMELNADTWVELRKMEDPWQTIEMAPIGRASLCGKCITFCPVGSK